MRAPTVFADQRLNGRRVAVTGARGFIGGRLVAALVAEGADVTAILRSRHDAGRLRALGVRVEIAAMTDAQRLRDCLHDCDILFHFAYDIRASGTENLTAFQTLMDAARTAGIGRVVHASSAVVYDTWPEGVIGPGVPITPGGGDYRRAKIAMEQALIDGPLPAAILQPTIVYGPGSPLWTIAPLNALRKGGVVLPDPVGLCPAVFVDDVAEAGLRSALVSGLGRERFLVSGPDRITWQDFYRGYADILGRGDISLRSRSELAGRLGPAPAHSDAVTRPSPSARISSAMRRIVGSRRFEAILEMVRARRPGDQMTFPDRSMLALYSAQPVADLTVTESRLGALPATTFAQGLAAIRDQSL